MLTTKIVEEIDFKNRTKGGEDHQIQDLEEKTLGGETVVEFESDQDEPHLVLDTNKNKDDVATAKAKKFLDLVRKGCTPGEAAEQVGMSLAQLKRTRVRKRIEDLTIAYHLPDEIRKLLVKAGLNRLFMMNLGKKDVANQKILLDTIKQMASDPDVGLQSNQQVGIQINLGELADLISRTPPDIEVKDIEI